MVLTEEKGEFFDKDEMYRQIVEYSFETTIIHANHRVLYVNQSGADFLRSNKESIIGANVLDIFQDDYKDIINERIRRATEYDEIGELIEQTITRFDGSKVEVELYCHPAKFGNKKAISSIFRDITARKEAERKLNELMNEFSAPIVPVSEGIAIIPLVGAFDELKIQQLIETVPSNLQKKNLKYIIVDFSGTYNINEHVIEFIFSIHSIMKLLGICPILTGIRPELAMKVIDIGRDFSSIKTFKNVKQALQQLS